MDDRLQIEESVMKIFSLCYEKYQTEANGGQNHISEKINSDHDDINKILQQVQELDKKFDEKINSDHADINKILQQIQELDEKFDDKNQNELNQLKKESDDQKKQIELLRSQIEQKDSLSADLNQQNQNLQKESADQKKQIELLRSQIEQKGRLSADLNQENQNLQKESADQKKQIELLRSEITQKDNEYHQLSDAYESKISEYADLEEFLTIKKCISSLNYINKNYIKNLCGGSDILALVSLGRSDNRISQLWQYLKDTAIRPDSDIHEIENLNAYFEFCIKVSNSAKPQNEWYVIHEPELGSDMDSSTCIRSGNSTQIGTVCSVLTKCVTRKNDVIFKAIVKIG